MTSWHDHILNELTPKVSRLTVVADPDSLLLEERILEVLRQRGFALITFEDNASFRHVYESQFRSLWDAEETTDLEVVLRYQSADLDGLPYDLLRAGRRLSFSLGKIFPNLSYSVIAAMDRGDLDAVYQAQERHAPGSLGENATKEFLLRHVFEIGPEFVKKVSDLLSMLLRIHYHGRIVPGILREYLVQLLSRRKNFQNWQLDTLLDDRETFFAFLQERWPLFLDRSSIGEETDRLPAEKDYSFLVEGPAEIPFDHHDVRVFIDNLFVEGLLKPIEHEKAESLCQEWMRVGIQTDPGADRERRLGKLLETLQSSVPSKDAKHSDWFHVARIWSELIRLMYAEDHPVDQSVQQEIDDFRSGLDSALLGWLEKRYAGLISLPPVPPVLLHHVPRYMARYSEDNSNVRLALVVVDGLAMDQWLVVRDALASKEMGVKFREYAVFSWIPTITSVSRQALFSGKPPIYFPDSIHTTASEPALWKKFWVDQGYSQQEIDYLKSLGDGNLDGVSECVERPKTKVVGLVVDKIDKIMHGMELGTAGMHNQVRQWVLQGFLADLLQLLLDHDFKVFLTSDHGNIEAHGCGKPSEGSVADLRGQRVRVYPNDQLRSLVKETIPNSIEWPPLGLPDDYRPLLSPHRKAFIKQGKSTVGHGGVSIEELIVPLVEVERTRT